MHGLRGSNFYVGCAGYVGQNIFYVGYNFYVGLRGSNILLRGLNFFAYVQQFLLGSIFGGESKKNLDWRFHKILIKST